MSHWQPNVSAPVMDVPWTAVFFLSPLVALVYFGISILEVKGHGESGKKTIAVRLNLTGDRHPKILISAIYICILTAAVPGIISFPYLSIVWTIWILLNHLLLRHLHNNHAQG